VAGPVRRRSRSRSPPHSPRRTCGTGCCSR
jgi:hypothetical protein